MYDQNHYFGLGPTPKPSPNFLPNTDTFSIIFEDLSIFQAYKNLCPPQEVGKSEKNLKLEIKIEKKGFGFGKKKSAPIPIPKLDLGFDCTLV